MTPSYRKSLDLENYECLMECENIAASTEEILWSDDETIIAEQEILWRQDMASIRRLVGDEATTLNSNSPTSMAGLTLCCPSCDMPFDKGKKRRLIDNCGHERCYTCMFHNEKCPLCNSLESDDDRLLIEEFPLNTRLNHNFKGSQITLYGEVTPPYLKAEEKIPCRTKVKTNGHFTAPQFSTSSVHPGKLPKTRPSKLRSNDVMVQSCPTPPQSRRRFFLSPKSMRSNNSNSMESSNMSDDGTESSNPTVSKKNSEDMYMRLGLLLGDSATSQHSQRSQRSKADSNGYEIISSNTSPLSTLTGSSEDARKIYSESTSSIMSMSMSMSGHSNCSNSSPIVRRRNHNHIPVQALIEERTSRRNLRRNVKSPTTSNCDSNSSSYYKNAPQLTLKPLFFEVPLQEPDPLFIGRHWIIKEIEEILSSPTPGVLLTGNPGTGKTALILHLVQYSCFGRRNKLQHSSMDSIEPAPSYYQNSAEMAAEKFKKLSSKIVAYHFCQADNNNTCLVPDFIHSLASQLCQAPQFSSYRDYLLSEQHLQAALSLKECIANPDVALVRGILEPLSDLEKSGKIRVGESPFLILIDALCEAEYHRPDHGDTITSFLSKHTANFPSWIRIFATMRTQLSELAANLNYARLTLDRDSTNESVNVNASKDMLSYINFRLQNSPSISGNIIANASNMSETLSTSLHKFAQHLNTLSHGSFLYTKLTLDLLERGHLVAKSSGYKVLPVNLAEIFLLHFNLRFPTVKSFERVSNILSVCLGALYPLTLLEIYYSVNALNVHNFISWPEFLSNFKLLSGFLIKRLDNTYMFFHPSFREWLIRSEAKQDEAKHGEVRNKFSCDLRSGHAGIAFRLSRIQAPLDAEKTLELAHHLLKAHLYRNCNANFELNSRDLQSFWIADSSLDASSALTHLRNVYSPNVKVSRLLLLSGASPDARTNILGNAPILCVYANEGILQMVSLLLEFDADVELTNSQGSTALALAAAKGHCDIVTHLIASGARPGHPDTSGYCALVRAARSGHFNIVSYLISCEWHLIESDTSLSEAAQQSLVAASGQDCVEIVQLLLHLPGVDVNLPDSLTGETPLSSACSNGCAAVCGALIQCGARVNVANKRGLFPLHLAVKEGHYHVVELLLSLEETNVEIGDKNGKTPLMYAASEGYVNLIELLIDAATGSVSKEDAEGLTALCWALLRGRQLAVQTLLDRGAKINHTDKMGRTPLDLAAYNGNPSTVQLLLDRGAVIEHVDLNGMRPLDRAIGCRNIQVIHCFLKKGAKLGPATWAMAAGKPDIILILLNKLLEDGNILYRKNRLQEAAHRYQYALKKFPTNDESQAFHQLRINFLLNYSRCRRKLNETDEAIELANEVLALKPDAYEAFYARAKAFLKVCNYEAALKDVKEALKLSPLQNMQVRKVLVYLRDEIHSKLNNPSTKRDFTLSVDALNE